MNTPQFFTELKERKIFQVASAYLVASWLITQVAATTFPVFDFPKWAIKLVLTVLIIGFPVALIWAWAQDGDVPLDEEETQPKNLKSRKRLFYASLIAASAIGVWLLLTRNSEEKDLLPAEIRQERLAILPFENQTNEPELDNLGTYMAEMINQGFMQLDSIEVVNPLTVQDFVKNKKENNQFSAIQEVTAARYVINGSYFSQSGDSILVNLYLEDPAEKKTIFTFPTIKEHQNNKEQLANRLQQLVLGYWVAKAEVDKKKYAPPAYDAYQLHLKAIDLGADSDPEAIQLYHRALEVDSNFNFAQIQLARLYVDLEQAEKTDSILRVLKTKKLSEYEQLWWNLCDARFKGDLESAYQAGLELYLNDPQNIRDNTTAGELAIRTNRPNKAIEILSQFNYKPFEYIEDNSINITRIGGFAEAYILTGQYEKAIELIQQYCPEESKFWNCYWFLIRAYTRLGKMDAIEKLIEENSRREDILGSNGFAILNLITAFELSVLKNEKSAKKFAEKALRVYLKSDKESDRRWLAWSYYMKEDWENAAKIFKELSDKDLNDPEFITSLGIIATKHPEVGPAQAHSIIQQIETMKRDNVRGSMGNRKYTQASIYAHLGEKEKAVELLKQAYHEGFRFGGDVYQFDSWLIPLFDYPPFQEFVKPKG